MIPVPLSYINFINISRKKLRYQHKIAPPNYYCRRAVGNKFDAAAVPMLQQLKIHIPSVCYYDAAFGQIYLVGSNTIRYVTVRQMHKIRGCLFKIQYGVQFDTALFVLICSPGKGIEREGDGGGIQKLDASVNFRDVVALFELLSQRFPDSIICIPEYFSAAMLILISNGGFRGCLLPA